MTTYHPSLKRWCRTCRHWTVHIQRGRLWLCGACIRRDAEPSSNSKVLHSPLSAGLARVRSTGSDRTF